jgi:hypothetical protein
MADVAKALGEEQKSLYRKRDALLRRLRVDLEADGIQVSDAHGLLSTLDWETALSAEGTTEPLPRGAGSHPAQREGES